jgi:heme-degrading monooxygenase HmoA
MVACLVELVAKPGKSVQLCAKAETVILASARQRRGYIDGFTLVCREESRLVLLLTVWRTEEDARTFDDEVKGAKDGIRELIDHKLRVQTYDVCNAGERWGRSAA